MLTPEALFVIDMLTDTTGAGPDVGERTYWNGYPETSNARDWGHEKDFQFDDVVDSDELPF